MNLSSNLTGNSYDENNFPHRILLTDIQVSKICKAFANGSSAIIKFSKTQLSKIIQSGGFLGMFNPVKTINPIKVLSKISNQVEDLSKKVALNDIIKTVCISKNFTKDFKTISGT